MALSGVLDNVTLSKRVLSGTLNDITLSIAPNYKTAILEGVTLSKLLIRAVLEGVTLSTAPPIYPVEDYLSFPTILSGSLADYLMEVYYHIVDGDSFGVMNDPESTRVNRLVGRYTFRVDFSDGSQIVTNTYYEFLYEFVTQVAAGKRLIGDNDIERHMSLSRYLPSTFNPEWQLAVALN